MNYNEFFNKDEENLTSVGQWRTLKNYEPISPSKVVHNGQEYIMMASNNYLGLTHHSIVKSKAQEAVEVYGTGSGGSRLISGTFPLFDELEKELASFKETESTLVFNTGYMANVGAISALMTKGDYIFSDELNHASIIDGCRLSGATVIRYHHSDATHLEELLRNTPNTGKHLIVTDGVFSMDGDIAPLDKLYELSQQYNCLLMVDDAHVTGVIGNGRGTAHYFNLQGKIDIQLGTLSKSLASVGGFVCGKKNLISYLINHSRSFIFSTALSPADIGAALGSLQVLINNPSIVNTLQNNSTYMMQGLRHLGIEATDDTPIFPILLGDNKKTVETARKLYEKNIILSAIRPPTVPIGESRLRMTVTASHTIEELDYVLKALQDVL